MDPSRPMSRLPQLIPVPNAYHRVCSIMEARSLPHAGLSLASQSNTPGLILRSSSSQAGLACLPASQSSIFYKMRRVPNRIFGGKFKDNDT